MDAGNGGYGSRCAEQVHVIAFESAMRGHEAIHQGGNFGNHCHVDFARDLMSAMTLRERDHADRQRSPAFDPRQWRPAPRRRRTLEPDELRRAAANVEQHDRVGARIHQRRAAGRRQGSLGFTVDDLEFETDLASDTGTEFSPVVRRATRFGRDQPRPCDTAIAHLVATDRERSHCTVDRRIADAPRGREPLAETDDARERVDDAEAVAGGTSHQEPAVVGAEIEGGIGRQGVRAVVTRIAVRRAPTRAGPLLRHPLTGRVEAAGCPALVLHQIPSCRAEAFPGSTAAALSEPRSEQV